MDPKFQALFYAIAVLFFVIEGIGARPARVSASTHFGWLGLASFALPFLYGAAVAGW